MNISENSFSLLSQKTIDLFWAKVCKQENGCWEYQGGLNSGGYGNFNVQGTTKSAHRVSLWIDGQTIPDGMAVDHICRNKICVNPAHLRIVTQRINSIENSVGPAAVNHAKTHCTKGHPLSGSNLYYDPNGGRGCRICRMNNNRQHDGWKGHVGVRSGDAFTRKVISSKTAIKAALFLSMGFSHTFTASKLKIEAHIVKAMMSKKATWGHIPIINTLLSSSPKYGGEVSEWIKFSSMKNIEIFDKTIPIKELHMKFKYFVHYQLRGKPISVRHFSNKLSTYYPKMIQKSRPNRDRCVFIKSEIQHEIML